MQQSLVGLSEALGSRVPAPCMSLNELAVTEYHLRRDSGPELDAFDAYFHGSSEPVQPRVTTG